MCSLTGRKTDLSGLIYIFYRFKIAGRYILVRSDLIGTLWLASLIFLSYSFFASKWLWLSWNFNTRELVAERTRSCGTYNTIIKVWCLVLADPAQLATCRDSKPIGERRPSLQVWTCEKETHSESLFFLGNNGQESKESSPPAGITSYNWETNPTSRLSV